MRGVGHAEFVGSSYFVVFGTCVSDAGQDAVLAAALDKLMRAFQFGSLVPAFQARPFFEQVLVFLFYRCFNPFRNLRAGLFGVEVRAFEVQTEYRAVRLCHQFRAGFASLLNHRHCGGRECGEDARRAVLHVRIYCYAESLFFAFHKVASAAAVHVHFDAARHDVAAFCVNDFCSLDSEVIVANFGDFAVFHDNRAAFKPTLGRENAAIDDLFEHSI